MFKERFDDKINFNGEEIECHFTTGGHTLTPWYSVVGVADGKSFSFKLVQDNTEEKQQYRISSGTTYTNAQLEILTDLFNKLIFKHYGK